MRGHVLMALFRVSSSSVLATGSGRLYHKWHMLCRSKTGKSAG